VLQKIVPAPQKIVSAPQKIVSAPHKIVPEFFDCWMRLLAAVPGSVLWLLAKNSDAVPNLRRAAADRGIDPERLVFASPIVLSEHLARHRMADLFLDTLPYGAHTTASDALWAGLPVVTCLGDTFAGRVGASLLQAVGMPELITHSLAEYEAKALMLAQNPAELSRLKSKLIGNLPTAPLFDTARYAKGLEKAYIRMVGQRTVDWRNRAQLLAIAARMMRRVLLDHAATRCSAKRGGKFLRLSLTDNFALATSGGVDLIDLDFALRSLHEIDPEQASVVELRFFGGLSDEEIGDVIEVSPATVRRRWASARLWLARRLAQTRRS